MERISNELQGEAASYGTSLSRKTLFLLLLPGFEKENGNRKGSMEERSSGLESQREEKQTVGYREKEERQAVD